MIATPHHLTALLARLKQVPWVALDTEADSLHAYPEKLCLIQISYEGHDDLVDPLASLDLAPFWAALRGHELIFHGADYDLRLIRKASGFVPDKIFDTMLASRLLGAVRFGLSDLLAEHLGVTLDKGSQKADWARRPLTEKMEAYARNDTRYLKPLSDILRRNLSEKGRLPWLEECCTRLIADCAKPDEIDPDAIWRVKGSFRLKRPALAVLRELWRWREEEAIASNRPPFFVLSHETLVAVAEAAVLRHHFHNLLPRRFSDHRRQGVVDAVARGLAVPPAEYPAIPRTHRRRSTDEELRRFDQLQKHRDARAKELGIDPTLIAPRATLLALAEDWDKAQAGLMNWQRALLV
ncbi:MAG: ribonuclease D [Verrucomicrobiota bacterium]